MGARQTFFGALAFADRAGLDAAIAEVLGPSVLDVVSPHIIERVRAGQKDRVLLVSDDADAPSSQWQTLVGAYHELAARALRGRVAMLYRGDGTELSVAVAAGPDQRAVPAGPPTHRYLALEQPMVRAVHVADASPLEFDVVQRSDGTRAIDGRDWLGFFGVLFERAETLIFEPERGGPFEWAQPAEVGSCQLVALPTSELLVVVEVLGPRQLAIGGVARNAIEIALHQLAVGGSEHDFRPGWRDRGHRRSSVWVAPGEGLVAFG